MNLLHNREALKAVCNEYNQKHNNYYNILLPIYSTSENYNVFSTLVEGSQDTSQINDPYFKQSLVNLMKWLAVQDSDIVSILIYRKSDGENFVYYQDGSSFGSAWIGFPFFDELKNKSSRKAIYGVKTWNYLGQMQRTYGIAGSIQTKDISKDSGSIMVAYNVIGLEQVFQQFSAEVTGRYLIVTKGGEVIFDSTKELYGKKFDRMDIIADNSKSVMLDGSKTIVQIIDHSNRGFYGINIVPDAIISKKVSRDRFLIFIIGTAISFLSALLYMIAGILSTNRVLELKRAMENVGSNNLDYRVPVRGKGDEFEHIAIHFNRMCDELQDNINKLYINEIKQKSAELNALQSGITPHFLYNTLEAIRSKAHMDGNTEVAEFIVMMASLLRNLVRSQMFIPIRQEINFCRMYLSMFILRYTDRFEYTINVSPEILDYGVPKGILQPILENYFVHGIREDTEGNFLKISGELVDGFVFFTVQDNGKGIGPLLLEKLKARLASLDTSHTTYGIANVHERIKLVFGQDSNLSLDGSEKGTTATAKIKAMTCEKLEQSIKIIKQREKEIR